MHGGANDLGPPLYSLLIAALLPLTHDAQLAGLIVAALAGGALTAALWALAATVYDATAATIAAAIVALLPISVQLGTNVLSEVPFFALFVGGLWFLLRALRSGAARDAAACGLAFGLAYLTRWQGLLLPVYAAVVLGVPAVRVRRFPRNAATASAVALLVALPYLVVGARVSGHLWLEGETTVNAVLADRLARGETYLAIADALDADGRPVGPEIDMRYVDPRALPQGPPLSRRIVVSAEAARNHLRDLFASFAGVGYGGGILVVLALVGLTHAPWSAQRRREEAVLVGAVAMLYLALSSVWHFWPRYGAVFIPFLALWAAKGTLSLAAWSRASRLPNAGAVALAAFAALAFAGIAHDAGEARGAPERAVGAWIAQQRDRDPVVLDLSDRSAFYAGPRARWSPLPYASPHLACRYVHAVAADYVVLDVRRAADDPPLSGWFSAGPSCDGLVLAYRAGPLRVYRRSSEADRNHPTMRTSLR
jgi:4-amino-4-deoxy-L-arabinose transferase-like glycosyltransferase